MGKAYRLGPSLKANGGAMGEGAHPPVGEAHPVLLHVQCSELLVVAQALLLLAGDTQVEAQRRVGLQLHGLARVQTWTDTQA